MRTLGPDHSSVANTHYNLGGLAKKEGDYAAARAGFEVPRAVIRTAPV